RPRPRERRGDRGRAVPPSRAARRPDHSPGGLQGPRRRRGRARGHLDWGRMPFPATRLRRLRKTGVLRHLVRETTLTPADLVYPMFVQLGEDRTPVEAMPGVDRVSISHAVEEAGEVAALGIPAVLLFGIPAEKDEQGSGAYDDEGVVQLAVRAIKEKHPDLL